MKKISLTLLFTLFTSLTFASIVDDPEPIVHLVGKDSGAGPVNDITTTLTVAFTCEGNSEYINIGLENCPAANPSIPVDQRSIFWLGMTSNFGAGGFLGASEAWSSSPNEGPNGPIALDIPCDSTTPFFVSLPVVLNDSEPIEQFFTPRIIKFAPDANDNTGLYWPFRIIDDGDDSLYEQTYPDDWNNLPPNDSILFYGASHLVYTFASPGLNEAVGNWRITTPHCVGGNMHHGGVAKWVCGKRYGSGGEDCVADFETGKFLTDSGETCRPARFNSTTQQYDILIPECYTALTAPRTHFWSQIDAQGE